MSDPSKTGGEKGTGGPHDTEITDKYVGHVDLDDALSDNAKYGTTQRGLKSRHIQLIALGGCIGTVSHDSTSLLLYRHLPVVPCGSFLPRGKHENNGLILARGSLSALELRCQPPDQLPCG